jgi:hypothetical protein
LQTLQKETSRQTRGQVLGIGKEQGLPPNQLEVREEHLKVRGAHTRNRDVATRKIAIKSNKKSHTYLATMNYWAPLHKTEETQSHQFKQSKTQTQKNGHVK